MKVLRAGPAPLTLVSLGRWASIAATAGHVPLIPDFGTSNQESGVSSIFSNEYLTELLLNLGVAVAVALIATFIKGLVSRRIPSSEPSFADRVAKLAAELSRSSKEVDSVLEEIASVMTDRQAAATQLEKELSRLSQHESELQQRIDALKDIPIPVAEHFAKLTESGERRSARRDYFLFGAGVLTSIVTAVALRWLGVG